MIQQSSINFLDRRRDGCSQCNNVVVCSSKYILLCVLLKLFILCFADLQLEAVYVLTTAYLAFIAAKHPNILRKFNGSMNRVMSPTLLLSCLLCFAAASILLTSLFLPAGIEDDVNGFAVLDKTTPC